MPGHELLFQYRCIAYGDTPPEGMTRREHENLRECFDLISGRGYDYRVPVDEFIRALEYAIRVACISRQCRRRKRWVGLMAGYITLSSAKSVARLFAW